MIDTPAHGLRRAIELAGGQSKLARRIGIRPQQISKWLRKGAVPILRAPTVAREVGLKPSDLRPDFFGGHSE